MAENEELLSNFDALIEDTTTTSANNDKGSSRIARPEISEEERVYNETYSKEEQQDVNNIDVEIPDTQTPIVILFGAPSMGKTMALLRLIRFFDEKYGSDGYKAVEPERVFRPKSDIHYSKMCDAINEMAYSKYTPGPTDNISFMLVKILNTGHPICQILEAPGEHYFDGSSDMEFPHYIKKIMGTPNRKIWVFFVQKDWGKDQNERDFYKKAIHKVDIGNEDEIVFLFNQADLFKRTLHDDTDLFETNIEQQYRGIFSPYRNTWIKRILYGRDNYKKVCFSSGTFSKTQQQEKNKKEVWDPGKDNHYCQDFWDALNLPNK